MANKIRLARGTKARIETIKETLSNYELVYSMDTHELGVKNNDGTVTYFGVVTELEWANILNKPTFAAVATSGAYADLTGKPDLDLKLDKDFSALPNQATPLLTDVLVLNRGATVQKVTLGNLLAQVDTEIFIVVATLPATGLANKIYLIPHTAGGNQNDYEEYIWVNNKWENIGKFSIDLSNYYNIGQVDGLLGAKVNANNPITAGTSPKITYDAKGLVTGGEILVASDIPNLDAGKITTGTFADARIPSLNASKINAGLFGVDRIPNLNASKINAGTFDVARIPNLAPSKITQTTTARFVTDVERTTWNAKLDANSIIDGGDL